MSTGVRPSPARTRCAAAVVTLLLTAGPATSGAAAAAPQATPPVVTSPSSSSQAAVSAVAGGFGGSTSPTPPAVGHTRLAGPADRQPADPTSDPLSLRIVDVTPAVAVRGEPVSLTVELTNRGTAALKDVQVNALLGRSLPSREALRRWIRDGKGSGLAAVATGRSTADIGANATSTIKLTIPANRVPRERPFGVAPLAIDSAVGARSVQRRSALPYFRIKEFEPLQLALALPITADPDPALLAGPGSDRERAWARLTEPDSRIMRILDGSADHPVTWVVDPALVSRKAGPGLAGLGSPSQTSGDTAEPAPGPAENQSYTLLRSRLTAAGTVHPLWQLPGHDPDIASLVHSGTDPDTLARLLQARAPLSEALGAPADPVIWPVADPLTEGERVRVAQAARPQTPVTFLVPASSVDPDPDNSSGATRQSVTGQRLLAYDDQLSNQLTGMTQGSSQAEAASRFVAETALLLAQAPGRQRGVFVTTGRNFDPDPNALDSLLSALAEVPWLRLTPTNALTQPTTAGLVAEPRTPDSQDPISVPPVTSGTIAALAATRPALQAFSAVLRQPSPGIATAADAQIALTSTRWRGAPDRYPAALTSVERRVSDLLNGVSVVPSNVNFFAESGHLQVTVVNSLDAEVADVHLTVDPEQRQSRLRVLQQPDPLRIRSRSRATVRLPVEAIASGVVALPTRLTTPEGTALGAESVVRAQVRPANGWIVLVIGSLVGTVLLVGVYRALRRGQPRVPPTALDDLDLS